MEEEEDINVFPKIKLIYPPPLPPPLPIRIIIESKLIFAQKKMLVDHSKYFEAMFQDHFEEGKQKEIELHSVDFDSFQHIIDMIHEYYLVDSNDSLDESDEVIDEEEKINLKYQIYSNTVMAMIDLEQVLGILTCSNMLQFNDIQNVCIQTLVSRIDHQTCWTVLAAGDMIQDQKMVTKCENYILWHFNHCLESPGFCSLTPGLLLRILSHPNLNISCELQMVEGLVKWCDVNNCKNELQTMVKSCIYTEGITNEEKVKLLNLDLDVTDIPKKRRHLPVVPCVVGHVNKSENKPRKLSEHAAIFAWDDRNKTVSVISSAQNVQSFNDINTKGFNISSTGIELLLSGGEYSFGYSNWQREVRKCSSLEPDTWQQLTSLDITRRHHSVVIVGRRAFLFGGFGKHRVILNTVVSLDMDTGQQTVCSDMPEPMYRPAVDLVNDNTILVVGKMMAALYHVDTDTWEMVTTLNYPDSVEFDRAIHDTDVDTDDVYLTSRISNKLYRLKRESDCKYTFCDLVGTFSCEAQNTCLVNGVIYNFYSDEFSYESVVESYDIRTGQFNVLWQKDVPDWDFSPYHCLGCFPLCSYFFKS